MHGIKKGCQDKKDGTGQVYGKVALSSGLSLGLPFLCPRRKRPWSCLATSPWDGAGE